MHFWQGSPDEIRIPALNTLLGWLQPVDLATLVKALMLSHWTKT